MNRKKLSGGGIVLALIGCVLYFLPLSDKYLPYRESRLLMDTLITIQVYHHEPSKISQAGFRQFELVEKNASFHLSDSELSRLNAGELLPHNSSMSVILNFAVEYFKLTEGYFDPTFAIIQMAYGFYNNKPRLPSDNEIKYMLENLCGLQKVFFIDDKGFKLASGSLIDLGGLAGGYAIEKAADAMREAGCNTFLIDDAGDIWFEGLKPDNKPWRIAVRDPRDNSNLAYIESFGSLAISTSGDYERFIEIKDKKYGHIMNPHTGRPVDYYSSLTIIASEPIIADVFSTAIFAMPPEKALDFVETRNIAALFLTKKGEVVISTAGKIYFTGLEDNQ